MRTEGAPVSVTMESQINIAALPAGGAQCVKNNITQLLAPFQLLTHAFETNNR